MKVHLKQPQRWVAFVVAALAGVIAAAACNKILGESELSSWWLIPAIGASLLVVVFSYFLTATVPAAEASAGHLRAGTVAVSAGAAAVLVFGGASAALYVLDETPGAATAARSPDETLHPTCRKGSICLWPEKGFTGDMWRWTRGVDEDGPVPEHLRNHIGSFVAQAPGCFVDSETNYARKITVGDWSGRYVEKFPEADALTAHC